MLNIYYRIKYSTQPYYTLTDYIKHLKRQSFYCSAFSRVSEENAVVQIGLSATWLPFKLMMFKTFNNRLCSLYIKL